MSAGSGVAPRLPRVTKAGRGVVDGIERIGAQAQFYGRTVLSIGDAVTRYTSELIRLIAQMSLGTGALVMIGGTTAYYGQSSGVYDHYFYTFLSTTDLLWSFVLALVMAVVIMLVHTYYGYTASGGPAGVGEAVGRAVRTSMITASVVVLFVSLAIYGQTGHFNLAG